MEFHPRGHGENLEVPKKVNFFPIGFQNELQVFVGETLILNLHLKVVISGPQNVIFKDMAGNGMFPAKTSGFRWPRTLLIR